MTEERFTRRTVTVVMAVIAALAFVFSFGNVWALALRLGVPHPIAPLVAPMVDLSVVRLPVALRFLALHGVTENELKAGTRLLHLCGLLTLALNTAEPLLTGRYGRACLDTVAPLLLLGWGRVGPSFLAQFHTLTQPPPPPEAAAEPVRIPAAETVPAGAFAPATPSPAPAPVTEPAPAPDPAPVTPTVEAPEPNLAPAQASTPVAIARTTATASRPALPTALLNAARRIADTHHAEHGQLITAAQLGTRMGVALPIATAALAHL
ncbi:SpdA protein [Streptomyces sp. V4-01]|uniref:SpdA protein n=1 Tax=Actinacidiphila polyblastidii TaxID=3110430 RepID=A0ABU7PKQ0_9ACTN|nr:SpdA protein [Streptomyces sp. V4-01]